MQARDESSVVFNLAEIMRLEQQRLEREVAAFAEAERRAERERAEQARLERETAQRERLRVLEREREAHEAVERLQNARAERLLRIRLEHEAQERVAGERLALEHARALRTLELDARRQRMLRMFAWSMLPCSVAAAALALRLAEAPAASAAEPLARPKLALQSSRPTPAPSAAVRNSQPGALSPPVDPGTAQHSPRPSFRPVQRAPKRPSSTVVSPASALDDIDREGDDPLIGTDEITHPRKR